MITKTHSRKSKNAIVAMYCPDRKGGGYKYTKALLEHIDTPCVWATAAQGVRIRNHDVASILWANTEPTKGYVSKFALFLRHVKNMKQFVGLCFRKNIQIAHIQIVEPFSLYVSYPFLRKVTDKIVMSVHNVDPHGYRSKRLGWLERFLVHRVYRKADLLFVFSNEGREALARMSGVKQENVVVLPMALHEELPSPPVSERRCAAEPRFLFFGGYRSNKGLEVLVEGFLKARKCDLKGTLVIRGKYPMSIENIIRERFLEEEHKASLDFVNAYVEEDEIDGIFRGADVLVLPYTQFSSQSGVAFLGYAYRMPILASRVGGLTELIEQDRTGILVEPGSADEVAHGLLRVVSEYATLAGVDSAEFLRQKYSWKVIGKATDVEYRRLLNVQSCTSVSQGE